MKAYILRCGAKERLIRGKWIEQPPPTERACNEFEPSRTFDGIWITDFETSFFIENAEVPPAAPDEATGNTWLEYDEQSGMPAGLSGLGDQAGAYRVRFVGRRARDPGAFGHSGVSSRLVLVDRVESVTRVPFP